jgi:hypothetical protein
VMNDVTVRCVCTHNCLITSTLMMEMETFSKTLGCNSVLTWLIAQEDLIIFSCHESFKSYHVQNSNHYGSLYMMILETHLLVPRSSLVTTCVKQDWIIGLQWQLPLDWSDKGVYCEAVNNYTESHRHQLK